MTLARLVSQAANPGFFNGAGNASTLLAWIDNSAVAKGVVKPQENAVVLAFMLYDGSCARLGNCACKASRHTCWTRPVTHVNRVSRAGRNGCTQARPRV